MSRAGRTIVALILAVACARCVAPRERVHRPAAAIADPAPAVSLSLVAYRTGGKWGEPVADDIRAAGDPVTYLILVNDDSEEDPSTRRPDFADERMRVPPSKHGDDDIGRLRVSLMGAMDGMRLSLLCSDPAAVRVFRDDGSPLSLGSADLARSLRDGAVDLWFEGLKPDPCFRFDIVAHDRAGRERARQSVSLVFAKWVWLNGRGEEIADVAAVRKDFLLAMIEHPERRAALPDESIYKVCIEGLPSRAMTELTQTSDTIPSERIALEVEPSEQRTRAKRFTVMYSAHDGVTITPEQRRQLRQRFDLEALHE